MRRRKKRRVLSKKRGFLSRIFRGKSLPSVVEETGGRGWSVLAGSVDSGEFEELFSGWTGDEKEKALDNYDILFSCIAKIVTSAQEAPLQVGRYEDPADPETFVADTTSVYNALLSEPNSDMDGKQFLGVLIAHLMLPGETFILELRDEMGQAAGLVPIPPSWVRAVTGWVENEDGTTVERQIGWEIRTKCGVVPVPLEDMTRIYTPHPADPKKALSPLDAARMRIRIDGEIARFTGAMLKNATIPSLALSHPDGWTDKEKADARAKIRDLVGGVNAGGPLFLSGQGASATLLQPWKDIDLPGLTSLGETRICSIWGVPPILIGLRSGLERSTYDNTEQATRTFFRQTMVGIWRSLETSLTKGLITDEEGADETLVFRFDLSNILELQEDANERAERATKLFTASIITRNEARLTAGYAELEDDGVGNVIVVPLNQLEVPADGSSRIATAADEEIADLDEDGGLEGSRHEVPWLPGGDNGDRLRLSGTSTTADE